MELLQRLDTSLYLALATSDNLAAAIVGLFFAAFATAGLGWWAIALLGVRARGIGRRGLRIAFTTAVGGIAAAALAAWLKLYVQRPRPFSALQVDALIQPSSFSFPSGDAALAFGAATGLWLTWPAARIPALLVAVAIGFSRVVVGAHYPSDVVAGAVVGVLCGIAAERLWARLLRGDWRVLVTTGPSAAVSDRADGGSPSFLLMPGNARTASGESIIRYLQRSASGARSAVVVTGSDPHGHPAQLPQIIRGFGHEELVLTHGAAGDVGSLGTVFWWQAPSGDRIRVSVPLVELCAPPHIESHDGPPALRRRLRRLGLAEQALAHADQGALLLLTGEGRSDPVEVAEAVRTLGLRARAVPDLGEHVAALGAPRTTHAGELVGGRRRPSNAGAGSAWVRPTQEEATCARLLVERCEPLDALTGGAAGDALGELWNDLLAPSGRLADRDGIDDEATAALVASRLARVRARGEALAELLAAQLAGPGAVPMIWNFRPTARRVVMEIDGIPRSVACAALGVAPLRAHAEPLEVVTSPEDGVLVNQHVRIEVEQDGSFVVIDRRSGSRSGRQNVLIDEGDRGDVVTHSFAGPLVSARGMRGQRHTLILGDRGTVTVDLALRLPEGLRNDRLLRAAETVLCPVRITITLDAPARHAAVVLAVDNRARDHRLRALCETGTRALSHRAETALGVTVRAVGTPSGVGRRERPNGDHATTGVVSVSGASRGLALGLDGLREYGIEGGGRQVAITIVRAVGWLSRGDLRERPGHVDAARPVPSAQCPGPGTYRYLVAPFGPPAELAAAEDEVRDALSPVVPGRGTGVERSFVTVSGAVELSALRAGHRPGTVLLRLVNRSAAPASATACFGGRSVAAAQAVDLRDGLPLLLDAGRDVIRTAAPPALADSGISVDLAPHEIGTYLLTLDG